MRFKQNIQAFKKDKIFYIMMIPGICWFLLFRYTPMYGMTIAFRDYNIFQGFSNAPFVGLAVFKRLFGFMEFRNAFVNTIILSLMKLTFGFPIPIILSLMINEVNRSLPKKLVQTAVLLPHFISWVVMGSLIYAILSPSTGLLRSIAELMGYRGAIPDILTNKETFRMVLVWSDIWKSAGYSTIIYLGVITSIDSQLYEAAEIDGAGWLGQIWHVTLPGLRPSIVILFLFRMGTLLNVGFEQIFIMSNPLVNEVAEVIDTYVYKVGMTNRQYSLAAAADFLKSIIGFCMVYIVNRLSNKIEPSSGIL